jgi:hypothetical protein
MSEKIVAVIRRSCGWAGDGPSHQDEPVSTWGGGSSRPAHDRKNGWKKY